MRAAFINVWEQPGCSCGCFHLSLDATKCVHHLKRLSVYVKDESLDSTSLGSSPQFHWMLEKGMVGLIGWWDGQSVQCVTCCWLSLCTCCSGLVFFFFFWHVTTSVCCLAFVSPACFELHYLYLLKALWDFLVFSWFCPSGLEPDRSILLSIPFIFGVPISNRLISHSQDWNIPISLLYFKVA